MRDWTEQQALDAWLDDLEAEESAVEAVRVRLQEPEPSDPRQRAYRAAAEAWLARGQGRVALALLERGEADRAAVPRSERRSLDLDAELARLPGAAGLPALTEAEEAALRAAPTPSEAAAVVRGARRRLEQHGVEARRLLRRWLDRDAS